MATVSDVTVSAAINSLSAVLFLVAFAILRLQPMNDRVYFSKCLKIFIPIAALALSVLLPVNYTDRNFEIMSTKVVYNANKLAKIVNQKKDLHNRLIYYTNKYERKHDKRPTTKVRGSKLSRYLSFCVICSFITFRFEVAERERVIGDPKSVVPAAFVSFKSRWGAAVCAQTQQTRNPIHWLTTWAPQPRDVYWDNLAIPFIELNMRRLLIAAAVIGLTFFFMIPIAFVQTLANIESIEKVVPFLKPLINKGPIKSVIQGFLPGIVLKIFILILPMIVMAMSKIEGFVAISTLEARSAAKFHLFLIVNVFFGSIVAGTVLQQLEEFLNQKPADIPRIIGVSIPMKATFFMTYIMVDGWAGIAAEILRLIPLIIFHLKNIFLVKTEKDREEAMNPGSLAWPVTEPLSAGGNSEHERCSTLDTFSSRVAFFKDVAVFDDFEDYEYPLVATKRSSRNGSQIGTDQGSPSVDLTRNKNMIFGYGLNAVGFLNPFLRLKIFVPIALLAFAVLLPVNYTGENFKIVSLNMKDITFGEIDKFSISNVPAASKRLIAHIAMAYVFTFWTCYVLYKEYKIVLVRNVPPDPDESVSDHVDHFFRVNHPDQYLSHQVVYNANKLAKMVAQKKHLHNRLIYYTNKHERNPDKRPTTKVSAFVSFRSRWGAAVCAQTQQTRNPTRWLTDWAPEPRDVYWDNLAIPFVELNVRRLLMAGALFGLTFCFIVPIALVQTLANIESIEKVVPFLKPLINKRSIKSVIQGFLPGIVLKLFLIILPMILMAMSKIEGFTALSALEARSAGKFHLFLLNIFLVKTEKDREEAMDPGSLLWPVTEPRMQLYFLLGLVYSTVTPILLPFIIIINVYHQKYESAASFWPDVNRRILIGLTISQFTLLGLLSTKNATNSTPFLLVLPVLTFWFHRFCKNRFESAFRKFPLQDAMIKDTLERATEPHLDLKSYLQDAYIHPVFKDGEIDTSMDVYDDDDYPVVATRRSSRKGSQVGTREGSPDERSGILAV
ncbi:protein of unknown function DUF221 [Cynara cardunculus var. scolymus]|uniref:Uncharacterized protein n=1 Tax=Cynara cardunculus var. scolymus TaxID=59895 RepID=A0A103YNS1_CYNCS|nr:protein of unknown function DUF221 [Cynara cardunculus var. scolymus]